MAFPLRRNRQALAIGLVLTGSTHAQTIIDDHFDGAAVSGWISQGNTRGISAHNITQTGSVLTSEVVATQSNTNRGIVSERSFEPAATGEFSMTFVVEDVGSNPQANGFFIGLVRNNDVFHRDGSTRNFGLTFFGQDPRTGSLGGFGLAYGDNNGATPADLLLGNSDAQGDVAIASFLDGFSATVSVDREGWRYEITGLLDALGTETIFTNNGIWADAGTDFDSLWPAAQPWYITGALQVAPVTTHTVAYDRITLVGSDSSTKSQLTLSYDGDTKNLGLSWNSQPGMLYTLRSETNPSSANPEDWPIYDGKMDLAATPPSNTLTLPLPGDPERFFVVEEFPAPPVTLFTENFDGPEPGWTSGFDTADLLMNTNWTLGDPAGGPATGPTAAKSAPNCYGTNLNANYGLSSSTWLRSPAIDLTGATEATLVFQQWVDMDDFDNLDRGTVRVLEASGLPGTVTELGVVQATITGLNLNGWLEFSAEFPAAALGQLITLEFLFVSDGDDIFDGSGWYLDDLTITTPAP
jgi:hypothetical protein